MKVWTLAVAVPLLVACGADRGHRAHDVAAAAAQADLASPETFALGTAVTPRGAVLQASSGDNFVLGGEVFLSVDCSRASSDQTIEVKWIDPAGHVIRRDARHAGKGTRYVSFSSGQTSRWKRGDHRAVVLIDGRTVAEKPFALM